MQNFNQQILIVIGASIFVLLVISSFLLFINAYIKKNNKHKLEKLELESQFSQTLLQSQLEIREQTLTHIGRELHDNLGQVASLIKINLNTMPLHDLPRAEEKLENTKQLVRQLLQDLKSLSSKLNSDRIKELGLSKVIELDVEHINKTGEFKASYYPSEQLPFLDPDKTIILYRMAQEILNNMVKHSEAKHIDVSLSSSGNLITLALSDDGKGYNVEEKKNSGGAGLINLQNRARLINAHLTIQSTPGNGSHITIELPI